MEHYQVGYSQAEVSPRNDAEIARLTRGHDVLVAEADDKVAGYLAWKDEAPGVAIISVLMIKPELRRFGIASTLLMQVGEKAAAHGIGVAITPLWPKASWAQPFLAVRGFKEFTPQRAPEQLKAWLENNGDRFEGQQIWWAPSDGLGTLPGLPRPTSRLP